MTGGKATLPASKKRGRGGGQSGSQPGAKRRKAQGTPKHVPLPEAAEDSDVDVSDEDLEFFARHSKGVDFLNALDSKQLDSAVQPKKKAEKKLKPERREAEEAEREEADYEKAPRGRLKEAQEGERAQPLPTKSFQGEVVYEKHNQKSAPPRPLPELKVEGITVEDPAQAEADAEALPRGEDSDKAPEPEISSEARPPPRQQQQKGAGARQPAPRVAKSALQQAEMAELREWQGAEERRQEVRTALAVAAAQLLEDPEAHVRNLRTLLPLTADADPQLARLAMLSLLAVFRDVLPGYRIRLPTEKELAMPVSKDVRRLREYEATLLRCYQGYLKALLGAAEAVKRGTGSAAHVRVAIRCLAGLLAARPHFNYTSDLLQALVPNMANRDPQVAQLCCEAVQDAICGDAEGGVALEAVQLVADLVRTRKCALAPAVVRTLFVLKLNEAVMAGGAGDRGKGKGKGHKKKQKKGKKDDEVSAAFKEAQAGVDAETRREMQSRTLEALFEIFFRCLKHATNSTLLQDSKGVPMSSAKFSRKFPLLGIALEGTARYGHLISIEFFTDVMAVLLQLLRGAGLPLPTRLQILLTASDLLRGQGEALNIDQRNFYTQLYAALLELPFTPIATDADDDPPHSRQLLNDTDTSAQPSTSGRNATSDAAAGASQAGVLLARLADQMLVGTKLADMGRLAAFAKRLAGLALHLQTGDAMGALCILNRLLRRNFRLRSMLEHEVGGSAGVVLGGGHRPDVADPAEAGALAEPLWELALLPRHYHPHIAQAARSIAAIPPEGGTGSSGGGHSSIWATAAGDPAGIVAAYSTASGTFRPAPQQPKQRPATSAAKFLVRSPPLHQDFVEAAEVAGTDAANAASPAAEVEAEQLAGQLEVVLAWHFREARRFRQHAALRRQRARLGAQLQLFQQHLRTRQAKAAKRKALAAAAAGETKHGKAGKGKVLASAAMARVNAAQAMQGKHSKLQPDKAVNGAQQVNSAAKPANLHRLKIRARV